MGSGRGVRLQNEAVEIADAMQEYIPSTMTSKTWMPDAYTPEAGLPGAGAYFYDPAKESDAAKLAALDPNLAPWEKAIMQDPSLAAKARSDPLGNAAQMEAIAATRGVMGDFRDIYKQGGMTAIDRARWEEAKNRNLQVANAQRQATLQNMEERGMAGSGVELASILAGQQGANQRQSAESLGIEAEAQKRKMDALTGAGLASGQLGNQGLNRAQQQFQEEFDTGSAADLVNQTNTQTLRDQEMRNKQFNQGMITNDVAAQNLSKESFNKWMQENYAADVANRNQANLYNVGNRNAANQYYKIEEPWRRFAALTGVDTTRIGTRQGSATQASNEWLGQKQQTGQIVGGIAGAGGEVLANVFSAGTGSK